MNAKEDSSSPIRASSRLSFTIFASMSVVLLAFAAGGFIEDGKVVVRSALFALGGVGAMIGCLTTRAEEQRKRRTQSQPTGGSS